MTRKVLRNAVLLVMSFALLVAGCSDDDDSPVKSTPTQIVHEGSGPIDDRGGRVEITDSESPLYGAYIEIPEGALSSSVEISISMVSGENDVPGDPSTTIVKFEPIEQTFSKMVLIGLPYNEEYDSKLRAFAYDYQNMVMEEIISDEIDYSDHVLSCNVSHLGSFVATGPYGIWLKNFDRYSAMRQVGDNIGFRGIVQNHQAGQSDDFASIETLPVVSDAGLATVQEVIENSAEPVFSNFLVTLFEVGDSINTELDSKEISLQRVDADGGFAVSVYLDGNNEVVFTTYPLDSDDLLDWMSGKPLLFSFESDFNEENQYYVEVEWSLSSDFSIGYENRYTTLYTINNVADAKKYASMKVDLSDEDNDFIDDDYQPNLDDFTPPNISGVPPSSPLEGENALLQANATDNVGVTLVKFERQVDDGFTLVGETTVGNANNRYQIAWNTLDVPNGDYQIRGIAFDAAGNSDTTNSTWTVSVANQHIPEINIVTPAEKQDSIIVINFDVADGDGDSNKFYFYFSVPDSSEKPMTILEATGGDLDGHTIDNLAPGSYSLTWDSYPDYSEAETHDLQIHVYYYNRARDEQHIYTSDSFWVDNYHEPLLPEFLDYEIDPASPVLYPGGSFILRYKIHNPNTFRLSIGLDAIARDAANNEVELGPYEYVYRMQRREEIWLERVARVPSDFAAGQYNLSLALLDEEGEVISATDFEDNSFEVLEANYITQDFPIGTLGMTITMVWIPPGNFTMGASANDTDAEDREYPNHQVTFTNADGFWMSAYEVTQEQYQIIMNDNPSHFEGATLPVDHVSWDDINDSFLPRANAAEEGNVWRLPSEAEWEYAARAGTDTRFPWGDDPTYELLEEYAWIESNSDERTHYVGTRRANNWGLYDMYGNVFEWVSDWYHTDYNGAPTDGSPWLEPAGAMRYGRGGCWLSENQDARPSSRGITNLSSSRSIMFGFRLVREAD